MSFLKKLFGGKGFGGGGGGGRTGSTGSTGSTLSATARAGYSQSGSQRPSAQTTKPKTTSVASTIPVGNTYGSYSGGTYTPSSTRPSVGSIGSQLEKVKAPDRVTYDNLGKDLQALYDEFGYYTPDWEGLDQSHQGILDIFGQQRENISGEHDLAKDDLQRSFDRAMGLHERGQDNRREDFADARRQLSEDAYMQSRGVEAGAASRGLGDSGVKEAAMIQGRMAMGQGMNEFASQYYEMEREATEAINFAREDYESTQVKLQQTLQSALTDIAGSEAMTIEQYTNKIEQMKRQMEADKTAVAQAKQNFLETEYNSRMALAGFKQGQYETELQAEFSKADLQQRQYESDRQYQLSQQQMAQQASQHSASLALQREQMQNALKDAEGMSLQDKTNVNTLMAELSNPDLSAAQRQAKINLVRSGSNAASKFIDDNMGAFSVPKKEKEETKEKSNFWGIHNFSGNELF